MDEVGLFDRSDAVLMAASDERTIDAGSVAGGPNQEEWPSFSTSLPSFKGCV